MKKKMVLLITILAVSLCGCSTNSTTQNAANGNVSPQSQSTYIPMDINFNKLLPKAKKYFKSKDILEIDPNGGELYCVEITDVTKKEFKKYKKACKEAGFNQVRFESDTIFESRTSDDMYYIIAQYTLADDNNTGKDIIKINSGRIFKK